MTKLNKTQKIKTFFNEKAESSQMHNTWEKVLGYNYMYSVLQWASQV